MSWSRIFAMDKEELRKLLEQKADLVDKGENDN